MKKGIVRMAAAAMLLGLLPMTPANTLTVQAQYNTPSVTAYASKEQLMTAFDPGTENPAISTLEFGKDASGSTMTWYILGKDTGVEGDNIAIFATAPIALNQMWWIDSSNNSLLEECDYGNYKQPSSLAINHYGTSAIRAKLKGLAKDTNYFSATEQFLMNATKIKTYCYYKKNYYTVEDYLYLLENSSDYEIDESGSTIRAGSNNQFVLWSDKYWNGGTIFWLRTPRSINFVWTARTDGHDTTDHSSASMDGDKTYPNGYTVRPAANLNLTSVLFASSVPVVSLTNDVPQEEILQNANPMTLRMEVENRLELSAIITIEK